MLVDSHCHLNYEVLRKDLAGVLSRCESNGVGCLQTISVTMSEFDEILAIANTDSRICCSVGVHPLHVKDEKMVTVQELVDSIEKHEKVVGLGETGLDYYRESDKKNIDDQKESFARHIEASQKTGVPIIVHTRSADKDTVEILRYHSNHGHIRGVIHCFTAGEELAKACLDMGMYISISGIVTFGKTDELRNIVKGIPLEQMLVETDSPYLAPVPHRGKSNEPSFVKHVAEFVAELKGVTYEEVEQKTTHNFFTLFNRAVPVSS